MNRLRIPQAILANRRRRARYSRWRRAQKNSHRATTNKLAGDHHEGRQSPSVAASASSDQSGAPRRRRHKVGAQNDRKAVLAPGIGHFRPVSPLLSGYTGTS